MDDKQLPAHAQMMQLASSKWVTKPLWMAAELGIADLLADGPKSVAELARETGTHERSLYRILRALACRGIFTESSPNTFGLTPLAETLKTDAPNSVRYIILLQNHPVMEKAWTEMLHTLKTGQPAFEKVVGLPSYKYLEQNEEISEIFNKSMTAVARMQTAAVVNSYDFSGIKRLVDVGGGHAALMKAILQKYPEMQGVVFDLPHVIEGTQKRLKDHPLSARIETLSGDFFSSVPSGDAIIMSHIIHGWSDEKSIKILKNCREALGAAGKVLICEAVILPGDEFSLAKLLDMEMMIMPGGQERTREEYDQLLKQSGFRLNRIVDTPTGTSVIEGLAV